MNFRDLLSMLDIEEADEFQFFENFADFVEYEDEIPQEVIYELIANVDMKTFIEIMGNYFDEVLENLPEDAIDIYTLLNTIKLSLTGMADNMEESRDYVLFAEELHKFRNWYSLEDSVVCTDKHTHRNTAVSLRDALSLCRLEKLGEKEYDYDFEAALEYELDEYVMAFSDIIGEPETEDDSDEDEDHFEEYRDRNGDLAEGFMYDDELEAAEDLRGIDKLH